MKNDNLKCKNNMPKAFHNFYILFFSFDLGSFYVEGSCI